jgi:hypothetical protein
LTLCRSAFGQQTAIGASATNARAFKSYGRLPLSFEPNRGQTTAHADYLARGPGYSVFLSRTSAVFAFSHHSLPASSNKQGNPRSHVDPEAIQNTPNQTSASESKPEVLEMQLAGVRAGIKAEGKDVLPGTANYFRGNDPAQWHTGIPTYKKVRYAGVYPGVDLIYYGNHSPLEYDFVVAPRANAGRIRLHFGGAKKVTLDGNGNLIVQMEDGSVSFHRPAIDQESEGKKQLVEGASPQDRRDSLANRGTGKSYRDGSNGSRANALPRYFLPGCPRSGATSSSFQQRVRRATGFGEGFQRNG